MPIATYPGASLVGRTVGTWSRTEPFSIRPPPPSSSYLGTPAVSLTAMDLSVEAEAFGAKVRMEADEVPTVVGRRVSSLAEIDALEVPSVGEGRTSVPLADRAAVWPVGSPPRARRPHRSLLPGRPTLRRE